VGQVLGGLGASGMASLPPWGQALVVGTLAATADGAAAQDQSAADQRAGNDLWVCHYFPP
jgi:hypothetical protein